VRALSRSATRPRIVCAPGNAGISAHADVRNVSATDPNEIVRLAREETVDLAVIGPEAPLVAGVADALRAAGIATVGPTAAAARIEGSKAFAKEIMDYAGVPTADGGTVDSVDEGLSLARDLGYPVAVKADGLAAGKGVTVARSEAEAKAALTACLEHRVFGEAGDTCVVEQGLIGKEVSLIAISDGWRVARFPAARDYKPIGVGDKGPNTGGMGSVSPIPDLDDTLADQLVELVHRPVIAAMAERGTPFSGVLYAGLMMTADGPKVLEFNVRFGDPETQAILPRLGEDTFDLLLALAHGELPDRPVRVRPEAVVAVVLASEGYPGEIRTGDQITGLAAAEDAGAEVFHAGTTMGEKGEVLTAGGRVLAVAARGATVADARGSAYQCSSLISFDGMQYRTDIGAGL
jgi:phosphoribosylamine--glycine ligase